MHVQRFDVELGRRLRQAREARGWTQARLADEMGLTQDAISLYERGERALRVEALVRLARALDVPIGFLLETHPDVVVVRGTPLAEMISRAAASPERIRTFRDVWQFMDWRDSQFRRQG